MIVHTNAAVSNSSLNPPAGQPRRIAAVDVEWQKNYRIKDGNRAFCYSIIWIDLPARPAHPAFANLRFTYKCLYLEPDDQAADLAAALDKDLGAILRSTDVLVGHQLCSDLAVVRANSRGATPHLADAQSRWRERRAAAFGERSVIDTRFDIGHLLFGTSRRLVDVCTELGLDVTQPELRSSSMTSLHREWLERRAHNARERISVLNLRHSLSSALLAVRALGGVSWSEQASVNRLLRSGLAGTFDWLDSSTFQALV